MRCCGVTTRHSASTNSPVSRSPQVITADFAYIRLHGPAVYAYGGSYSESTLEVWAERIRGWKQLRRVYAYFDNDEAGYAVRNALALRALLEGRHA